MIKPILLALILVLTFQARADFPPESSSTSEQVDLEPADPPPSEELPPPQEPQETPSEKPTIADEPSSTPLPPEYRPSSSSGEPIFDWSKHRGEKEVAHPFAEKGLIRIKKDGTYIYKTEESKQKDAFSVSFGIFDPSNLSNPDAEGPYAEFKNNYDQTNAPAIMASYEWQFMKSPVGKMGLRAGSGLYVAQGNGHFNTSGPNNGLTPREIFTFIAMPNTVGVVYRMQFWDRQLFVPYGEGGGIAWTFAELRDDNKNPKFGGALGAYFAAGVALNLTYFDKLAALQLDREYGINRVYLTAEYRPIISLSEKYDFSSDMIDAGFLMEF